MNKTKKNVPQIVDQEAFTESCKISTVGFDFRMLNSGNLKFQLFDQEIKEHTVP